MTKTASESAVPVSPERPVASQRRVPIVGFALTTLLSAFLIFQVQPVISKCVLPWFGGTPAVWTTCLLFFQVLLFAGYAYAHVLRTLLPAAGQGAVHLILLAVAASCLPIEPDETWKPSGQESPSAYLLWLLAAHVGLPYFVLSSTGPLIQAWMSDHGAGDRVYRLYALSNVGSLGALVSYPFVVEPWISVSGQSTVWSMLFCGFVILEGWLAVRLLRVVADAASFAEVGGEGSERWRDPLRRDSAVADAARLPEVDGEVGGNGSERWRGPLRGDGAVADAAQASEDQSCDSIRTAERWRGPLRGWEEAAWIGLPAFASLSLLVVTNHVCQDIAVIPFLWVLPLSLYLLSFIICFDSPIWYRPKETAAVTLLALVVTQTASSLPYSIRLVAETVSYFTMLFGVCLLCHGEAARLKPEPNRLTWFYLCLSAGGAIGGLLVAVVCPFIFDTHFELPLMLAFATAGTFMTYVACPQFGPKSRWSAPAYDWSAAYRLRFGAAVLLAAPLLMTFVTPQDALVESSRNFFGVLKVTRDATTTNLVHGQTIHGMQRFGDAAMQPTSYYGRESGVGLAIESLQDRQTKLRVGVVGLGCGVLACYGRAVDHFDMIEINPDVVRIAKEHFSFLRDTAAESTIHLGDGRLVLERITGTRFDLLVLDAFSSDAIPAHLLTREAIELYRSRITPGGVIAIHVSNNHLDLVPLVHRLAEEAGLHSREVHSRGDRILCTRQAKWMLLARQECSIWSDQRIAEASTETIKRHQGPLWTDQHHNLASVLKLW